MSVDEAGTREWARESKASWELTPLVEMHKGQRVQVGFELELYARLPPGLSVDAHEIVAIWDRLRAIAESLPAAMGEDARIDVEPYEAAGRLRPETNFEPEVLLKARLFHAADYFEPVDDADRRGVKPLEERLTQMGLHQRSW